MQAEKQITPTKILSPEEVLVGVSNLPVAAVREIIREQIRQNDSLVVVAETGSGKTTCLPFLLLELRNELKLPGGIAVTQPRRVATRSITARVADMTGCEVGEEVGYNIRFENVTQENTAITFMTDGILLRKIQYDPLLLEYSIVMIDEAHERSLNIDLCLGLIKEVNQRRAQNNIEPVYTVISSATIERNKFATYLDSNNTQNSLEISGKMFPVKVSYESETSQYYDFTKGAAYKVKSIIDQNYPGDILIFMPGKKEISDTIENIKSLIGDKTAKIIPLHSELSPEDQDQIFNPSEKRKIIVSTNIAETSVTIDGIIHVIDPGLIKQTKFDPVTGIEQLVLVEHSLSGLEQRKGRAGRTAPGFCHRLFTEASLAHRPQHHTPEIQRSNLAQIVLAMKKVGIKNIFDFQFIDQPDQHSISQAINTLKTLEALDEKGDITKIGEYMSEIGLEPRLSRMIIEATKSQTNCLNEICIIASFLDGKNVFIRPTDETKQLQADRLHQQFKKSCNSDFAVIINVWNAYVKNNYDDDWAKKNYLNEKCLDEVRNVRLELIGVLEKHDISIDWDATPVINKNALGRVITAGLLGNLMIYSHRFQLKKAEGGKGRISFHPNSIFSYRQHREGALFVSDEIFMNPKGRAYACNCFEVRPEWLPKTAPKIPRFTPRPGEHHQKNTTHHVYNQRRKKR